MTLYTNDPSQTGLGLGTTITTGNSGGGTNTAFSSITGSAPTQDNSVQDPGGYDYLWPATTGVKANAALSCASAAQAACRLYVTILGTVAPSSSIQLMLLGSAGANYVGLNTSGKLYVDINSSTVYTSTVTLSQNVPYRIEFGITIATSGATVNWALYSGHSTTALDSYTSSASNTGSTNITAALFGKCSTSGNWASFATFGHAVNNAAATLIGPMTVPSNGSITLGGTASAGNTATGAITLGATSTAAAIATGTGSLTLAAAATGAAPTAATGAVTLAASPVTATGGGATLQVLNGFPNGFKVEVAFNGVWTDITADVDMSQAIQIRYGRTAETSPPSIASCQLLIDNASGNYTPGVPASTHWPYVLLGNGVRVSSNPTGSQQVWHFTGVVQSWVPGWEGGVRPTITVVGVDVASLLGQNQLPLACQAASLADSPAGFWPLNDPAGTVLPAGLNELSGNTPNTTWVTVGGPSSGPTFGAVSACPNPEGATGMAVAPSGGLAWGAVAQSVVSTTAGVTLEGWVNAGTLTATTGCLVYLGNVLSGPYVTPPYFGFYLQGLGGSITANGTVFDGTNSSQQLTGGTASTSQVHVAVTVTSFAGIGTFTLYLNGVNVASVGSFPLYAVSLSGLYLLCTGSGYTQTFSNVAYWNSALTATQIANHYALGAGLVETTGARIARYLTFFQPGGAPSTNLDAGQELVGFHPLSGKSILQACQEIAITEGGGAAFYITPDGKARFCDRTYRTTSTPLITYDASGDLDEGHLVPAYDSLTITNDSTVTRNGGEVSRYAVAASIAQYGDQTDSATTYASTPGASLYLAMDRVARFASPTPRVSQLPVDLLTAQTPGVQQLTPRAQIGTRIRVGNLPGGSNTPAAGAAQWPTAQTDLFVEGWTATFVIGSGAATGAEASYVFDTSPADRRFIFGDAIFGRFVEDSPTSITLVSTITAGATSLQVQTSGTTYSTSAGDYPLYIQIDAEILAVTAAPSGGTSPQTFTVTRAQLGTASAAHTAGAAVNVYTGTFTL